MDSLGFRLAVHLGWIFWVVVLLGLGLGCTHGPVLPRQILSDPAMRFSPGQPIVPPQDQADESFHPMPPDTVSMRMGLKHEPGKDVLGNWLYYSLRAAVELFAGMGLEVGYGFTTDRHLVQKLDGFAGPIQFDRTRYGPDAALVLDDGTSVLRLGYRYRDSWQGVLNQPCISARTSVFSQDTVVEVSYRHTNLRLRVPASRLPAREPVDDSLRMDRLHAAVEQGFLPGWNLRLELAIQLEEGFLQSPYRLVSLWAQRSSLPEPPDIVPRVEPERHPESRVRWGGLLRVRRTLPFLSSVLEVGIGHGSGSWRVEHSTAEIVYHQRLSDPFTLSLGVGAYHQTRAIFYRDDYPHGPFGSFWSADRNLCSFMAYWAKLGLVWRHIPVRGRVLGIFRHLAVRANIRVVLADYGWATTASNNGFTSYPSLVTDQGSQKFDGGLSYLGNLGFEGGF